MKTPRPTQTLTNPASWLILLALLATAGCWDQASPAALDGELDLAPCPSRTDWFHQARWGVMFHYTSDWQEIDNVADWNKAIREFDVQGLARQLHEVGAGYFLITAQHMGYPLAPNKQVEGGKLPSRDLIPELADALAKYDIPLMLYYPTGMGIDRPKAARRTAVILEEYSRRYGRKVRGWWLDNNSAADVDLQKIIADACRAGNRDAILGFSGPKGQQRNSPYEDYTAGNSRNAREPRCYGRFIQGDQWHMLTHLSHSWAGSWAYRREHGDFAPRFSVEEAVDITTKAVVHGGVITWDVPPMRSGLIHPAFLGHLKAIGRAARNARRVPAKLPPPMNVPASPAIARPPLPDGGTITTLPAVECRTISASQYEAIETQRRSLRTGVGTGFHNFLRGYVMFDLSGLDRARPVHSATLYLNLNRKGALSYAGSPVIVSRFTQPITAQTQQWYHFPVAEKGQRFADVTREDLIAVDVTEIVRDWLAGQPNCGLRLSPIGLGEDWLRYPATYKVFEAAYYDARRNPAGPHLVVRRLPK